MSDKPILGWSSNNPATRVPIVYNGQANLLTAAQQGNGKSLSVVMPNLIRCEGSMVVSDFKGELASMSAVWRAANMGQRVIIFDPFNIVYKPWIPGTPGMPILGMYDPLDFIRSSKAPFTAALKIAEACIPVGSTEQSHFPEGAQQFLVAVMKFVIFDELFDYIDEDDDDAFDAEEEEEG